MSYFVQRKQTPLRSNYFILHTVTSWWRSVPFSIGVAHEFGSADKYVGLQTEVLQDALEMPSAVQESVAAVLDVCWKAALEI